MSPTVKASPVIVPAQLDFLAIYNPSLGTTDDTLADQIVYYSSSAPPQGRRGKDSTLRDGDKSGNRGRNNEQLRQIGLAQGMVEFGRSFSNGKSVDTVDTEKSRIILHELEAGWWILASINLTILPVADKSTPGTGKGGDQKMTMEYSSREVKPVVLLLGDLLRAHSIFLLHHAASMSALFVRTRRSKFVSLLGRYWDTYLSSWNVLMHGNPANMLYSGIKLAACGELGFGVGEEERGSGEREVLEGFVGRIDGLVDIVVSRFGDANEAKPPTQQQHGRLSSNAQESWLGSGHEPAAEDGVIFSGTGALSRKSLRDVSYWIEDLHRWGSYAYGVIDNPTSSRGSKKTRRKLSANEGNPTPNVNHITHNTEGLQIKTPNSQSLSHNSDLYVPPVPIRNTPTTSRKAASKKKRPSISRAASSFTSTESDSNYSNKLVQYLKFGYGTHWSLGGTSPKKQDAIEQGEQVIPKVIADIAEDKEAVTRLTSMSSTAQKPYDESPGHFMIGLLGDMEENEQASNAVTEDPEHSSEGESENSRLLLRTLTLELEREIDARAEAEISIDLGNSDKEVRLMNPGSEHTGTSKTSFESQDRNKTKKLRVVVYANRPFIFVLLFELRTESLAFSGFYRSLHCQIGPLIKPLLHSTAFRALKPDILTQEAASTPIYDLIWDPQLLTITSSIPNIPDPSQAPTLSLDATPWSRIEALNTHMQIISTYLSVVFEPSEKERTCKTSRGWWIVWTRLSAMGSVTPRTALASSQIKVPIAIAENDTNMSHLSALNSSPYRSRGTSTMGTSMYSGPAHPFPEASSLDTAMASKDKEIFLIRRASDYSTPKSTSRVISGISITATESAWTSNPGRLAQGIGVDTKKYIDSLLSLNR